MATWTEHARRFIVTTDDHCLQQAVAACDDQQLVAFLQSPDLQKNRQVDPSVFTPVFERLVAEDRTAEACMVRILGLRFVALAMAELETYDAKHREFIETTCADLANTTTLRKLKKTQAASRWRLSGTRFLEGDRSWTPTRF